MTELECLSLMELLDLRAGAGDPEARRHLDGCPRCQAVLDSLPARLAVPALPLTTVVLPPRPAQSRPERVRAGQLWRVRGSDEGDWSWVVAVLGLVSDAGNRILVVPVVGEPELATDRDLLLDGTTLGYDAFLDLQNLGSIIGTQLVEYLATLPHAEAEALVALYRWTLVGDTEPKGLPTGPPVLSEIDLRLLAAQERGEALRALWREADLQVTDFEDEPQGSSLDTQGLRDSQLADGPEAEAGVAQVIRLRLEGPDADWDRAGLLERTRIDGARFNQFLKGHLDLTDRADVHDLATVLHVLDITWPDAEEAVVMSLRASPGGRRSATGPAMPMAARSHPDATEEAITRDLYADQSNVDQSADARTAEIAAYITDLRRALDEFE
jgi:hypothetical protein